MINANSAVTNAIKYTGAGKGDFYRHVNFEFKNATGHGVAYNNESVEQSAFINCISHDNGGYGWILAGYKNLFVRCQAYNNTSGFYLDSAVRFVFSDCVAYGGGTGFYMTGSSNYATFMNCIAYNNVSAPGIGFALNGPGTALINSISDSNTVGVTVFVDNVRLFYNRITNNGTGIDFSDETTVCGWNYLHGNTTDLANPSAWSDAGIYACYITEDDGTNTNKADTDVDDGYVDQANQDYRLKADRTYNGDGSDVIPLGIGS